MPSKYLKYTKKTVMPIISSAIEEDLGAGDITSLAVFEKENPKAKAKIIAKDGAIVCGIDTVAWVYGLLSKKIKVKKRFKDGQSVKKGDVLCEISGPAIQILIGERLSLNLISYMSGIATMTRQYVELFGKKIDVMDTRKTHPNMRLLQKYAVKVGGGKNHRMGLYDQVLIKDNHIDILAKARNITRRDAAILAIQRAKAKYARKKILIEVEVDDEEVFEAVLKEKVDIVMLDNMPIARIRKLAKILKYHHPRTQIEVSGKLSKAHISGIKSVKEIDRVSLGRLTHSFKIVDYSMTIE